MEYIYDNNNNIVKFNPIKKNWVKKVEYNNYYYGPFFLNNCFKFKGVIDINKFIQSLNECYKVFDILLSTLKRDNDGNVIIELVDDGYKECLEIEECNGSVINCTINDTIPLRLMTECQKIGFDLQFNSNSKVALFKLTTFNDGFAIGFCISHSYFDVSSFVYFFKYLSNVYNDGIDNIYLNKPLLMDYNNYKSDEILFNDHNQAINYANNNGIIFEGDINFNLFKDNTTMMIKLSPNQIDNYKLNNEGLSKNDIISALILKIYTFTSKLNNDDMFTLRYPCNIRKIANIGDHVIGNLFKYCYYTLKVSDIRDKSIIELAYINREYVSNTNIQQFKDQINWFEYIQCNNVSTISTFAPSFNKTNISNWNQHSYDQIRFNNSTPYSLETTSMASGGTNMISFDINNQGNKTITTSISIPNDCINKVIHLGNSSKLFSSYIM